MTFYFILFYFPVFVLCTVEIYIKTVASFVWKKASSDSLAIQYIGLPVLYNLVYYMYGISISMFYLDILFFIGGGMFNIGSGSTAPRSKTTAARRRNK